MEGMFTPVVRIGSVDNRTAISHFLVFANNIKDDHVSSLDELDGDFLCSINTWQLFAGHLLRLAVSGQLMKSTAEIYLNGAKHAVKERFKDNPIFKESEWQTKLVYNMKNEIKRICIDKNIRLHSYNKTILT